MKKEKKKEKFKIPFKSVLSPIKNLEKRNLKFHSLTKKQQRQEIAYEGLQLILSGKISEQGASRQYWSDSLLDITAKTPEEFQNKLLNKLPPRCHVCQNGLLMLAQIRIGNKISPWDKGKYSGNTSNRKGFSYKIFNILESAYEEGSVCLGDEVLVSKYRTVYKPRTLAIMANMCCNIISNGDFKEKDMVDYLTMWNITLPAFKIYSY